MLRVSHTPRQLSIAMQRVQALHRHLSLGKVDVSGQSAPLSSMCMCSTNARLNVLNQAPPLPPRLNLYETDAALASAIGRTLVGRGWAREHLKHIGALTGSAESAVLADAANNHPPVLHTHDRVGNRIDRVEFHPVRIQARTDMCEN